MAAMRLFTESDFSKELEKYGLRPTDTKTAHHTIWKDERGECVPVPHGRDCYPDHILDTILRHFLKEHQAPAESHRQYDITLVKDEKTPLKLVE